MPHGAPRPHHWLILALLTTAGVSFALMQTLVIPALPFFREEFDTSPAWATWIVSGFLLSSSVLTPILGKLGDAHGKKRLLVACLAVFGLGSLGAAAAPSLPWLVACRVLQGAGAAVFPLSFGIIRDEFPPERVGVAVGMISTVFGIGGGLGLVLSGVILDHLNWHWLFLVGGIPVLGSAALVAWLVPESPVKHAAHPDYRGAALLSLAIASLLVALSEGDALGWTSVPILALAASAAALLATWVRVERRTAEPMVDLRTFSRRGMAATNASTLLVGFAVTGLFVLLPAFIQADEAGYGFGASLTETGLFFIPCALAMVVAGPVAGTLGARHGRPIVLWAGLAVAASGFALIGFAHDTPWTMYAWLGVVGTGLGTALTALGALVLDHCAPHETGVASGMNTIMRTIGGAIGAQVVVAILAANTLAGAPLPDEQGFTVAFLVAAAAALLALIPASLLRGTRPWFATHPRAGASAGTRPVLAPDG
jgi:EmrB/QacA subfamily drug resistance transporter